MHHKLIGWIALILGILLLLPLLGITTLGTATSGVIGWLIAIGVLIIGISKIFLKHPKKK